MAKWLSKTPTFASHPKSTLIFSTRFNYIALNKYFILSLYYKTNEMILQTPVIFPKANFDITHRSTILLFGSCFSENIGLKLLEDKFSVNVNPFGVLYNPSSISNAINRLIDRQDFTKENFVSHNNSYHSFMHHGSFSSTTLNDALCNVNKEFRLASTQLEVADFLLITFGTSYVFRWKETGEIVGNCHKIPANQFVRERLTIDQIIFAWSKLIERLLAFNPNLKILFTVSPIRHFKDGAHENQLSKSILHLSIDNLMQLFPSNTFYFPAYEIMMDELRDYRFYTDDMLHPSQLTQNYIWKRFGEFCFSEETQGVINDWQPIQQSLSHRPYDIKSEAYKTFLHRTNEHIEAFEQKHPFISCQSEKDHLARLIQNFK